MEGREPTDRRGPHLFVADLYAPELGEADAHHLTRVLRARVGDPIVVSDGRGRWREAEVVGPSGAVAPTGPVVDVPPPDRELTVAFAPVKGDRPEWAVQKLTEVGIDHIVVVTAARSVVRWEGDRAVAAMDRLRRVAREAASQSHRSRLPDVRGPVPVAEALEGRGAVAAQVGGPPLRGDESTLVVGPEGGLTDDELALARSRVTLGPNVLRTETAAVVGGALMVALREGLTRSTAKRG